MNLPIPTTPSATAVQANSAQSNSASAAQGNQGDAAADPFGSILARQIEDAGAAPGNQSATILETGSRPTAQDKKAARAELPVPDNAALPQAELLAAMLNFPGSLPGGVASGAQVAAPSPAVDGAGIKPDIGIPGKILSGAVVASPVATDTPRAADAQAGQRYADAAQAIMTGASTPDAAKPLAGAATGNGSSASAVVAQITPAPSEAVPAAAEPSRFIQAVPQTAPAAIAVNVQLNTPLGSPRWGDDFNSKVTWLANQQGQSAEIHLNPPHLGPIDIVLKISEGQAAALFVSPHAAVRDAVTQALPRLHEMLADNGIMLGNTTVSDHGNHPDFAREQQPANMSSVLPGGMADVTPTGMGAKIIGSGTHNGMVDTFA